MVAEVGPVLRRKGVCLAPGLLGPGWSTLCQMPTAFFPSRDRIRMYFSSRDARNRSHVFRADLEAAAPFRVISVEAEPVLGPGRLGTYDAEGVMPSAVVDRGDEVWLYTIGWTVRKDVPYHNAIGVAYSRDRGRSFTRLVPGPIVGTGPNEPYFCGTCDVQRVGTEWLMWYMSATEWRVVRDKPEPRYHLKLATSDDGLRWRYGEHVAIDYVSDAEGGIARATVLPSEHGYWMWFCYRGISDYRGDGAAAYRLGLGHSLDGKRWERLSRPVFSDLPLDFDRHMECYPTVLRGPSGTYVFYNGSDFGRTGVGYAEVELAGTLPGSAYSPRSTVVP